MNALLEIEALIECALSKTRNLRSGRFGYRADKIDELRIDLESASERISDLKHLEAVKP